jgi:CRISPR-associated Csx2 family protein
MLKFISLLGTRRYIPCNYYLEEQKTYDCCYIQQAIIEILEKRDTIPGEIVVFMTEDARNKNWNKNAFDETRLGLGSELSNISKRTNSKICDVAIPSGQNEDELWELFNIILKNLEDGDEIILDITHSFRYLPMLTFIVLNYARIVKNCKLSAVYYGAFETLGSVKYVEETMTLKERNAPIFDLTPFVVLFDWTIGIDRYLATGDASIVKNLTKAEVKRINIEINKNISEFGMSEHPELLFKDPRSLKELTNSMKEFSDVVLTCRGQRLTSAVSTLIRNIDNVIESTAHGKIKPLAPIMDMLKERFGKFSTDNDYINIVETAKWCLDNGMYQQGLTILQEGLISYVCDRCDIDKLKDSERNNINTYSYMVRKGYIDADYSAIDTEQASTNELFKLIHDMAQIRNDINHAGWRKDPSAPSAFPTSLRDYIGRAESLLSIEPIECDETKGRQMFLIFSHELTDRQLQESKERFGISKFVALDDELLFKWANVPPNLDVLDEYLDDITRWIDLNGQPGDYALVQGDYGATMKLVNYCISKAIIPVYATTNRKVVEEKIGEKVKNSREFEHMKFRKY